MDEGIGASVSIKIGKKAFISSVLILLALLVMAGVLTRVVPTGSYARLENGGAGAIDVASFQYASIPPLPVWKWFTAPIEVLWSPEGAVVIGIILFFLCIGGAINLLNQCGVFSFMIDRVVRSYAGAKYRLIAVTVLVLMLMSALTGIMEEAVFIVPLMMPLAQSLGMDPLIGLGMSLLAMGFGFAAALTNPFTIGVAQRIAGVPLFSGLWFRALVFAAVYGILTTFLIRHARRIEGADKLPHSSARRGESTDGVRRPDGAGRVLDGRDHRMSVASRWFIGSMAVMLVFSLTSSVVPSLSDYAFPATTVLFLIGGIGAGVGAGKGGRDLARLFVQGIVGMSAGVVLMLMAAGVKHIIASAGILDTIIFTGARAVEGMPRVFAAGMIYLLVLLMNFFIPSASAKSLIMMPILAPLSDVVGLNRQIAVLAFQFGDGFSNVIYPTNPITLISVALAGVSYPYWFRRTVGLQLVVLGVTAAFLVLAVAIGLGPV
ncbi:MAG: AbgT family transporter [Clostridia bacterium]|nr:AbgT family transporter [Clostridia bacterium]